MEEEPRYDQHIQTHGNVYPNTKLLAMPCWISPDGKVYHCHGYEHVWMAGRICRTVIGEDLDGGWDASRRLEALGYIKLTESGEVLGSGERETAQTQLDVLYDISCIPGWFGDKVREGLSEEIQYHADLAGLNKTLNEPAELAPIEDW